MAREILKIKTYVDGVNDVPFPSAAEQIGITEYTYTSKRMGGVTLSATLMYRECLDKKWTGLQYVEFRGEKYFISATPSSGKDNEDARYEHTLSFIAERDLKLNNVYFYDAVSDESTGDDKYKSNSTNVVFFGTIEEFVARLNESLKYSGLDYTVVIDEGITSEGKLMSFEDQFFFGVLQEIYNTYELPFYFVGKVIHIGFTSNAITQTFKYGFDNELLSIKKNNANYRIINRCTGIGSEDNIPYYYPNNSPKGDIVAQAGASNTGVLQEDIKITDIILFSEKFDLVNELKYSSNDGVLDVSLRHGIYKGSGGASYSNYTPGSKFELTFPLSFPQYTQNLMTIVSGSVDAPVKRKFRLSFGYRWMSGDYSSSTSFRQRISNASENCSFKDGTDEFFYLEITEAGEFQFIIQTMITITAGAYTDQNVGYASKYELSYTIDWQPFMQWTYDGRNVENIEDMGISIGDAVPTNGDTIKQVLQQYIIPSKYLMPPVYRETLGAERFYNALNDTYTNPDTGEKYVFENEYDPMIPREHKQEFEEIKPTIKGMKNAAGQRMDQILDIAFDKDDNDEVDEEGNYLHSHFFVKLPKYDGDYGFNLFDHAIEEEEMSLSMTSGQCGACEFKVKVDKDTMKNPVQVNSSGNLMRDESGNVITSGEFQDRQNDTSEYEVWIALEKEESTYGQIMPNVRQNLKPKAGDSFVILHIDLPQAYILNAENGLKEAIIKYMAQNNSEKYNFSITFSRIYLEEHPEVEAQLNENARIQVEYDGTKYEFYISQYTYKCLDEEALPEITVEITDTITVNKTTLQNTADAITQDMNDAIGNIDFLAQGLRYFIRKDVDDEALGRIRFRNGIEFGNYTPGLLGSGGALTVDGNNSTHLEVDFLTVRRKAEFTSISVQELKHIGGQLILSPAAMVCSSVEDVGEAYRCYFKTGREDDGDVGSTIFNEFVVGDQARIQNFNQLEIRYYWRLVVGIGEDYIDLSKTDCDAGSVVPRVGDNIVQLGNREDTKRQAAQILSCYGESAPSYIMYNGINSYSLEGKNITGIIYNPNTDEPQFYSYGQMFFGDRDVDDPDSTFVTFQQKAGDSKKQLYIKGNVSIGPNSSGLGNLSEWSDAEASINNAQSTANSALQKAQDAQDYIDNTLPDEIAEINNRLDGVVENWFYEYTPSRQNEPAATWISDGEEADHVGDTFTNIQQYVDDATTPDAGKSWRWALIGGQYNWTPIADSDAVKALQEAARAQDTADQKRRVFVTTPYTPYDVGDMWMQGPDGEIMRCIKARQGGSYTASDWDKASKYTDDTVATDALNKAEAAQDAADAAQQTATEAFAAAGTAQAAAEAAQADATAANETLGQINSDSVISPPEKTALKQQHSDIKTEYSQIIADAQKYGVSTTAYTNAYNAANAALTKYTASTPEHITVGSDYASISAYYTARQTILDSIAAAAKKVADDAQKAADDAQAAAGAAQDTADQAAADASQAIKDAAAAQSTANAAKGAANSAQSDINAIKDFTNKTFADGVIDRAEAASIEKYKNSVNETLKSVTGTYNTLYANTNLTRTAKTALKTAYDNLTAAINNLLDAIDTAIANSVTTDAEKKAVDDAYAIVNTRIQTYNEAVEDANDAIQDYLNMKANILASASMGNMLYDDPEFKKGMNSISKYDNSGGDLVTLTRKEIAGIPNASGYGVEIVSQTGTISPGRGGFCFSTGTKANRMMVCRFIAKVPEGRLIQFTSNATGDGSTRMWLTARTGTGKWEEYAYYVKCGDSGSFSSTFFFYIDGTAAVTWQIAYATVFDLSAANSLIEAVAIAQSDLHDLSVNVSEMDEYIDGAFRDGVINDAESIAIKKYLNTVNESWADLQASYNVVYNNSSLTGTPKTNLKSAYNTLSTQKTSLVNVINRAVSNPSSANITAVDTAFTNYNSAVGAFKNALENANKSIQDGIRNDIPDVDYLRNTFGYVEDVNGVVLGKLVAVKDEDGNVKAMLNGSDLGKDNTHGKLLLATGMDNIQNPTGAKTKIYEDGYIHSQSARIEGLISAQSGRFGAFWTNTSNGFGSLAEISSSGQKIGDTEIMMNPEFAYFRASRNDGNEDSEISASVSRIWRKVAGTTFNLDGDVLYSYASPQMYAGFSISVRTNKNDFNGREVAALRLSAVSGNGKAYAVLCENGMFAGLRPKVRTISAATTLGPTDHTILVDSTASFTITLRSSAELGQEYILLFGGSTYTQHTKVLACESPIIHCQLDDVWEAKQLNLPSKGIVFIVYANDVNGDGRWWVTKIGE